MKAEDSNDEESEEEDLDAEMAALNAGLGIIGLSI